MGRLGRREARSLRASRVTRHHGPAYDAFRAGFRRAYGRDPVDKGIGGSIPFVQAFSDAYPHADLLLTGASDPASHIHGPDESLDLGELERSTLAEAVALRVMAG